MNLKDFIVPKTLDNGNENQEYYYDSFRTRDLVYLDDKFDLKNATEEELMCSPTDYAIMNGALVHKSPQRGCRTWLRSAHSHDAVDIIDHGKFAQDDPHKTSYSSRLTTQLDPALVVFAQNASPDVFKIREHETVSGRKYHTMEYGEFPKTYVGYKLNAYLEYALLKGILKPTDIKYVGHFDDNGKIQYNVEYTFKGQKFIRVISVNQDERAEYENHIKAPESGTPVWAKAEPITWLIKNWDDLPREINPEGTGSASVIILQTEQAIISGIPFYPNLKDKNRAMYQNSTIRGYLNGINVNNIKTNGNTKYTAPNGGDFREHNFLAEALSGELSLTNSISDDFELTM